MLLGRQTSGEPRDEDAAMLRFGWLRRRKQSSISTKLNSASVPSAPCPAVIEPLERRALMSWPPAAAVAQDAGSTLYVNQYGFARVPDQRFAPGQTFQSDRVYFDDGGLLSFYAASRSPLDAALYSNQQQPVATSRHPRRGGSMPVVANVSPQKDTLYLAIRPAAGFAAGTYTWVVHGVPSYDLPTIAISPQTHTGTARTDISGTNDYDFFRFTTTHAGNWTVRVTPTPIPGQYPQQLDATMNIYNRRGQPVRGGGSFTQAINQYGPGGTESWFGTHLRAHTTYYIRIDGQGDSIGMYRVSVSGP